MKHIDALTASDFSALFGGKDWGLQQSRGEYAVLLLLVRREEQWQLVLEKRAESLTGHQPGEVCFPGGRRDPGERPQETALRETWEEVGIPAGEISEPLPLAVIQEVSGRVIYPFLACVSAQGYQNRRANPQEVAEIFTVPLRFFLETEPEAYPCRVEIQPPADFPYEALGYPDGYAWRHGSLSVPIYSWRGRHIWGMTARTIRWFSEQLRALL